MILRLKTQLPPQILFIKHGRPVQCFWYQKPPAFPRRHTLPESIQKTSLGTVSISSSCLATRRTRPCYGAPCSLY